MATTDQSYINDILNGDTHAFAVLVDRYKDLVFTLTLRMMKNREEAEEVSQDTFIKVYRSLPKFKGDSKFSTWIYRVAYNCCLDRIKKNKKFGHTVTIEDYNTQQYHSLNNALDNLERKERAEALKACMDRLPGEDAYLLTLYYFEEQTLAEISKIMRISINNTKVKLFRSRKRLATILKEHMEPEILKGYERTFKAAF